MKVGNFVGRIAVTLATSFMATQSAVAQNAGTVKLAYSASLVGKQVAAGEYKVAWETHSPEAVVTLTQKKKMIATVSAKWVDRDAKYETNSVLYSTNPDGSYTILEMRFAGRKGALVFGEDAPKSQLQPAKTSTLSSASVTSTPAAQKIQYLGKPRVAAQSKTLAPSDSTLLKIMLMQQQAQPTGPAGWQSGVKRPVY